MKSSASSLLSALLALAGVACATAAQAEFQDRTLRMSTGVSKAHPLGVGMRKMAQCVGEKSGGKMKLQTYFDSSLGNDTTASNAVRAGSLDIVLTSTAPLVGTIPQLAVFDLPFLFNNEKEADQVLDGKAGDYFAPKFAAAGFVNLAFWENGFRSVTNSKRPITKWEDLQGVKLRVMQNKVYIDTFTTLGTNPVPMAFSEVYLALETKAIDGQENPVLLIDDLKFQEVQRYLSLTRHTYSPAPVLYSKKLFDQLSADEQTALRDCAKIGRDTSRSLGRALEAKTVESLRKQGMQVNEISSAELQRMRERVKPVYEAQAKTIGDETMNVVMGELQRVRSGAK